MLYVWLLPVLLLFLVGMAGLYVLVCCNGRGSGVRSKGRCVCGSETDDPDLPE